ncbi:MAG TPA: tetratricopeptide repeat protein [Ktedonobacteraceae bacterium]
MASSVQTRRTPTGRSIAPIQSVSGQQKRGGFRSLKRQFLLKASLILLLSGVLTLAGASSLNRATSDLATINDGSVLSIDAAQALTQYVEDIDAKSADFLATAGLIYKTSCFIAGSYSGLLLSVHDCDEHNIDTETVLANQELYRATHNVTYAGEKTAIERISTGLESYLGYIRLMRADFALAAQKTDPNDPFLRQAYQAYLDAGTILHDHVKLTTVPGNQIPLAPEPGLPTCTLNGTSLPASEWTQGSLEVALDCLSFINHTHLTQAYDDTSAFLTGTTIGLFALCLLFCSLLLFATLRMIYATHRVLNPGLIAACLIGLMLSFTTLSLFASLSGLSNSGSSGNPHLNDGAFQQLVNDDYASIYDIALLKRYASTANADKSRWLIALEFHDQPDIQHWRTDWQTQEQDVQALMNQAHADQTWDEELEPLAKMDSTWKQYTTIDGDIRDATQNKSLANPLLAAEEASTWNSYWAFQSYTDALDSLSSANRVHYAFTLNTVSDALNLSFRLNLIFFPLAGLLGAWGIWVRLKDF